MAIPDPSVPGDAPRSEILEMYRADRELRMRALAVPGGSPPKVSARKRTLPGGIE